MFLGFINTVYKDQDPDDIAKVENLVLNYLKNSRSMILAVVSAKSDIAIQGVLRHVKALDPLGSRTLGIITKPDLLRHGSAEANDYLQLAKNDNIRLKLGWHTVRNLDSLSDKNSSQREAVENEMFRPVFFRTCHHYLVESCLLGQD